jgi:hypothetical protein
LHLVGILFPHELKEFRMEVIYTKVKEPHNKPGRAQRGSRVIALLFQNLAKNGDG